MLQVCKAAAWAIGMVAVSTTAAFAGGAWVYQKGDGEISFGASQKTADESWTTNGNLVPNNSIHDFRYGYLNGEFGFGHNLAMTYSALYLNGYEGATEDLENNRGLSELFVGLKWQFRSSEETWPMAVSFNIRTSELYDQYGTYDRHLFLPDEDDLDADGDTTEAIENKVNSEWRGLLGEDYNIRYHASRNIFSSGWLNLEIGYTFRTGNLADEVPFYAEAGFPSGWKPLRLKGAATFVQSVGNNDEVREPTDRFGCSDTNCFPDASRGVLTGAFFFDLGKAQLWWVEAGWNQWVWGESTRRYQEPYLTVGRRF